MKTGTTETFNTVFKGLDENTLNDLRNLAEEHSYPPQTVLCRQGEIEHTFYVIVEGQVNVTQILDDGQERFLTSRGPREYFGELSLLDDSPRMANCVTATNVTVLEITEEVFHSFLENSPAIALALVRHVTGILRSTDQQAINELSVKNAELEAAYRQLEAAQSELVEKERLERELEIAAEVQHTLLPEVLPAFPDYRFAAYQKPARQVGGDFYDVVGLDDRHVSLLLADVADKSVQAALFMAVARTLFMVEGRRSLDPSNVAAAVHRGVIDVAPSADVFVTAFYAVLHRPTGQLTYAIAGHERPLLARPGIGVHSLGGGGRFLGMLDQLELSEHCVQLRPGDRLIVFSDGVPDATSSEGRQYRYDRLTSFLSRHMALPATALVAELSADIEAWIGDAPPFDDVTLLILEAKNDHESA